ncbi:putative TIM-barrel fold metal-dependent hydrolase [Actinobacteria bacterium IMCC26207]|nr:putative TIM-barrel fold metal-dependent hydrolase [Actinobacteria bacterium IMCC26207]
MNTDDLILISVDDHVVEPPDMFQNHLPAKYKDAAPRVVVAEDGSDVWLYEGQQLPNIGLNAVAGKPHEEYGIEPTTFAEMRTGCYDIHDRVQDMNANGVLGSMCFPSFPQFCGQLFARTEDKQVALAMLQAYNDWHVDEWCGSYPGRFIPLALPPVWDPQLMAAEVHRMAAKGCRAVTFSENPEKLGWPSFHNEHWDPFWQAVSDTGTVVCLHIGSSSQLTITSVEAPINVMISLQPMNLVQAAADLLWSRVMTEFPLVRFALSEGGIGWIPYFLERVDYVYEHHQAWTGQDLPMKPSELFHERFITCFIDDASGLKNRDDVGIEQMTWECDYPHSDSTWPESPERLAKSLAGIPDDEIRAITYQNAMRLFHYDPFAHLPIEESTVSALRKQAIGVDTSPVPSGKEFIRPDTPVRIIDLAARAVPKAAS